MRARRLLRSSLASGAVATATSVAALALVARLEGKGAAQPLNATSHWLYGDEAAGLRRADIGRTTVGLATHAVATVFWASFFEAWVTGWAPNSVTIAQRAVAIAAFAALVDYTVTPKRFTPGWELVLSKRGMAVVYAGMAAGFIGAKRAGAWR